MQEIEIRDWAEADLTACVTIAKRAWPESLRAVPAGFTGAYIQLYRHRSTWTKTVTAADKPVGVIFGRFNSDVRVVDRVPELFSILKVLGLSAFGSPGRVRNRLTFLRTLISAEIKAARLAPAADGEITLLFLDPEYHGRGIGATLVRNYIRAAEAKGAGRLTLFTDETSNWRFYERLGWRKVDEFVDEFESFLVGRRVRAFIYDLELRAAGQ